MKELVKDPWLLELIGKQEFVEAAPFASVLSPQFGLTLVLVNAMATHCSAVLQHEEALDEAQKRASHLKSMLMDLIQHDKVSPTVEQSVQALQQPIRQLLQVVNNQQRARGFLRCMRVQSFARKFKEAMDAVDVAQRDLDTVLAASTYMHVTNMVSELCGRPANGGLQRSSSSRVASS